jgi:hypothetical protein
MDLEKLPQLKLPVAVENCRTGDCTRATVTVKNPTANVALMIRLKVLRAISGERVLPVFYDDNYFSLLPGESRVVSLEFTSEDRAKDPLAVGIEGWNIVPQQIRIP